MSDGADFRQQQENEEERIERTLEILRRMDKGLATHSDVEWLAHELGLANYLEEACY